MVTEPDAIRHILAHLGEPTEAAAVENLDQTRRFIGVLRGMGCELSLDDFISELGSVMCNFACDLPSTRLVLDQNAAFPWPRLRRLTTPSAGRTIGRSHSVSSGRDGGIRRPKSGDPMHRESIGVCNGLVDSIGNTPLIRLKRLSEMTGCDILGKAEFMNPGGSVKDRAALAIVLDAERRQLLRPGGTIIEGTAGNTGIGLAVVGNARGYRTVIVIPDSQSQEKKDTLRSLGATLYEVPAVPYKNPNQYVHVAERLAAQLAQTEPNGAIWARQFDNVANRSGHYETTGPEIWRQTGGKVAGFVSAVGTGGTLAGVAMALRERNPAVKIALADPPGAAIFNYYTRGELKAEGSSITEGIGQGRITGNLEGLAVDFAYHIPDDETVWAVFDALQYEGLCVGASTGVNLVGALRLARELGPGHTIVTILCDSGLRYQATLFNPGFLRSKGLPVPAWLERSPDPLPTGVMAG